MDSMLGFELDNRGIGNSGWGKCELARCNLWVKAMLFLRRSSLRRFVCQPIGWVCCTRECCEEAGRYGREKADEWFVGCQNMGEEFQMNFRDGSRLQKALNGIEIRYSESKPRARNTNALDAVNLLNEVINESCLGAQISLAEEIGGKQFLITVSGIKDQRRTGCQGDE